MILQNTKYDYIIRKTGSYISQSLVGPWKKRSIGLLLLLFGYYLGTQITVYFIQETGQRSIVILVMIFAIELMVRLRNQIKTDIIPLYILALDNLRIGIVYAVVLEAFKLGS